MINCILQLGKTFHSFARMNEFLYTDVKERSRSLSHSNKKKDAL
ncbi:hypothetical protein [Rubritalea tangerina]